MHDMVQKTAKTSNFQVRIDTELKNDVEKILDDMGLDLRTAFRMFLKKIDKTKAIPFSLGPEMDENGFTKEFRKDLDQAIKELNNPNKLHGSFGNAEDLIEDLNK